LKCSIVSGVMNLGSEPRKLERNDSVTVTVVEGDGTDDDASVWGSGDVWRDGGAGEVGASSIS